MPSRIVTEADIKAKKGTEEDLKLVEELVKAAEGPIHSVFNSYLMSESGGGWESIRHIKTTLADTRGEKTALVHARMVADSLLGRADFNLFVTFWLKDGKWVTNGVRVQGEIPEYNQTYPI